MQFMLYISNMATLSYSRYSHLDLLNAVVCSYQSLVIIKYKHDAHILNYTSFHNFLDFVITSACLSILIENVSCRHNHIYI